MTVRVILQAKNCTASLSDNVCSRARPYWVFGRQGSIYDLLADAKQKTARIAINAWGLNGNYGEYTADSRSVDQFVKDERTLLPVFSVGDWDGTGISSVTAPSTAKNVLSVGVSTTGSGAVLQLVLLTKYPDSDQLQMEDKA